jgi:hypothetical protein
MEQFNYWDVAMRVPRNAGLERRPEDGVHMGLVPLVSFLNVGT